MAASTSKLSRKNLMKYNYPEQIPIPYKIAYYLEGKEFTRRDEMMMELEKKYLNTVFVTEPELYPVRFRYIPRTLNCPENIVRYLRDCGVYGEQLKYMARYLLRVFDTDNGGALVMRLMPDHTVVPDEIWGVGDFVRLNDFECDTIEDATETLEFLLQKVMKYNYHRISGALPFPKKSSFEHSQQVTLGFIRRTRDMGETDELVKLHVAIMEEAMSQWGLDEEHTLRVLDRLKKNVENRKKMKVLVPLYITDRGWIQFTLPTGETEQCKFRRGRIGNALYILYLRQIERAAADKSGETPRYICTNWLTRYRSELLKIYEEMCPGGDSAEREERIENLVLNSSNERSHINTYFYSVFDLSILTPKHYTIEPVGKDDNGDELLEVGLDVDDFDLGRFSIHRLE